MGLGTSPPGFSGETKIPSGFLFFIKEGRVWKIMGTFPFGTKVLLDLLGEGGVYVAKLCAGRSSDLESSMPGFSTRVPDQNFTFKK